MILCAEYTINHSTLHNRCHYQKFKSEGELLRGGETWGLVSGLSHNAGH